MAAQPKAVKDSMKDFYGFISLLLFNKIYFSNKFPLILIEGRIYLKILSNSKKSFVLSFCEISLMLLHL